MVYHLNITDFFVENNRPDIEFIQCTMKLLHKGHKVVIPFSKNEVHLKNILQQNTNFLLFLERPHSDVKFMFQKNSSLESSHQKIIFHSFKDYESGKNKPYHRIKKPWGYEEIWTITEKYVGKIIYIKPNHRLSLQYHKVKVESIYVQEGILLLWESSEAPPKEIPSKHFFNIQPNIVHRFGAKENGVYLFEVSTTELDDVIRLEDDYGRNSNEL